MGETTQDLNQEKEENEAYHEIVRRWKSTMAEVETLKKQVEELKEANLRKNAKEKTETTSRVIGTCVACGHELTADDAARPTCPYCGESGTYRPNSADDR